MTYGTPEWRPWVLDEDASQPFFRLAVESGINFFDTANVYSLGRSEEVTGRALKYFPETEDEAWTRLRRAGLPQWQIAGFLTLAEYQRASGVSWL